MSETARVGGTIAEIDKRAEPQHPKRNTRGAGKVKLQSAPSFDPLTLAELVRKGDDVLRLEDRKDALKDDFSLGMIRTGLGKTSSALGADRKAETTGVNAREDQIAKDAKYLMCTWLGEQWFLLLLGLPFMFLASLSDLFVPDYIGRIVDAFTEENYEGEGGAH